MLRRLLLAAFLVTSLASRAFAQDPGAEFVISHSLSPEQRDRSLRFHSYGPMEEVDAKKRIQERLIQLDSFLAPRADPYTGKVPLPEICQKAHLPEVIQKDSPQQISYVYSLYSSATQVLGLCINKSDLLKTQFLLLYCRTSKKLLFGSYFYPSQSPWLQEPVASCK